MDYLIPEYEFLVGLRNGMDFLLKIYFRLNWIFDLSAGWSGQRYVN